MASGSPLWLERPSPVRPPRKQPIRDSIIAFLSKPRSASEVAAHIERTVPIATGHLAAMRRKGLVVRLGYAAYALSDYDGPPLAFYKSSRPPPHRAAGGLEALLPEADPIRKRPL